MYMAHSSAKDAFAGVKEIPQLVRKFQVVEFSTLYLPVIIQQQLASDDRKLFCAVFLYQPWYHPISTS